MAAPGEGAASDSGGAGKAGTRDEATEQGTPRAYHFFQAASFNPDLRTRTVEIGKTEREAFSLVELMIVIAALFAAEWFIRKLVRLA